MALKDPSIPESTTWELILWLFRQRGRLRVTGNSMRPTLNPTDVIFIDRTAYAVNQPVVGDIVVAHHPRIKNLQIIKRVAEVTPEGLIDLRSDNSAEGSDSREFGLVNGDLLVGRVTSYLPA